MRKRWFGAGLVLAAFAGFAGAQQPIVVQTFVCLGEEPFWRFEANRTTGVHNTLGAKGKREVIFRGSLQPLGFLKPPAIVWRGDSTHLPRETLVVTLREEACRSTMADTAPATHRALLSLKPGEAVTGCCTVLCSIRRAQRPDRRFFRKGAGRLGSIPARSSAGDQCVRAAKRSRKGRCQGAAAGQDYRDRAHRRCRRASERVRGEPERTRRPEARARSDAHACNRRRQSALLSFA